MSVGSAKCAIAYSKCDRTFCYSHVLYLQTQTRKELLGRRLAATK
ncbi:MAG: hypothetical protein ACTS2F_07585 [Thainema sp.]